MQLLKLKSFDNKNITVNVWDEVADKKAAIIISHGMAEHAERYNDFANFLNSNGYVVLADNHRGHRYNEVGNVGMTEGDSFTQTVEDMKTVVEYAAKKYGLPVGLIGHSYGSFLSQKFVELYSDSISFVILSGTAYMKTGLVRMGSFIASMQKMLFGEKKLGKLINTLSFGAYNKGFEEQGQDFAWLSRDKAQVEKYENDEFCGYTLCIGYYSYFFKGVLSMYGEQINTVRKDFPIMIAVGGDDPVSSKAKFAKKLYDFYKSKELRNVDLKIYDDARHEILNEINNKEVYKDMLDFINKAMNK